MDARRPIETSRGVVALSVSFNLECDCFVVATNSGFHVFDATNCKLLAKRTLPDGGVGLVQIFGRTNILALVGGSRKPIRSRDKVAIWDEKKAQFVREISCSSAVCGIFVLQRQVVVVLRDEVCAFGVAGVGPAQLTARHPTADNPRGLTSVSLTHTAFPGRTPGQVQLVDNQTQRVSIIPAHASALGALVLSRDGTLLATASEKGTLIRVWATANNARVAELRRGVDRVTVYSLAFNPSGTMLACTSDKGTLHVFDIPSHAAAASSATTFSPSSSANAPPFPPPADDWAYEDSDAGYFYNDTAGGGGDNGGGDGRGGRWGVLGKLPFMPQYFRDTVSFASAEFTLDDGPGPYWAREQEEALSMDWPRLPRGLLGWTQDNTVVVVGAGVEPKYERFTIAALSDGRRVCVRQAWANYMRD